MTIIEYYNRFCDLMQYDSRSQTAMHELVEKFEDRVNGELRHAFSGGRSTSLAQAFKRASYSEQSFGDGRRRMALKQAKRERGAR